jgi:hypothetical protein
MAYTIDYYLGLLFACISDSVANAPCNEVTCRNHRALKRHEVEIGSDSLKRSRAVQRVILLARTGPGPWDDREDRLDHPNFATSNQQKLTR